MLVLKKQNKNSVSVTTSSTKILSTNNQRKFALITNTHNIILWLSFGDAAEVGKGFGVPAGLAFQIDEQLMWHGEVYGIYASTSATVGYGELS